MSEKNKTNTNNRGKCNSESWRVFFDVLTKPFTVVFLAALIVSLLMSIFGDLNKP